MYLTKFAPTTDMIPNGTEIRNGGGPYGGKGLKVG